MLSSKQSLALIAIVLLVLIGQFLLIWRINVNWDEFLYLSQVHDYIRGGALSVLQTSHVHLFSWLPAAGENEVDQIIAGRILMWIGLVVTVVLIARLAAVWVSPSACWIAPLAYLSAFPVLRHGASFRADSLLAPLSMLVLVLLATRGSSNLRLFSAGAVFAVSLAITLKAVLFLPLFLLTILLADWRYRSGMYLTAFLFIKRSALFCVSVLLIAAVLLVLHKFTLTSVESTPVSDYATSAARKTIFEVPLFPRGDYFEALVASDWVMWSLLLVGLLATVIRRNVAAISLLSLLPLVFYRNAFPYYYLVMLAPVSVLAAAAVDQLVRLARGASLRNGWVNLAVAVPLLLMIALQFDSLRGSGQDVQRLTIEAVHSIFPEPVPYIDHSGMISSFPKANFFMSSWGMESYQERDDGFMQQVLRTHRPPLLVANTPILRPEAAEFGLLNEEDRRLIESSYVRYWGAISVAGAFIDLRVVESALVRLPFHGSYRLESSASVLVDGVTASTGFELKVSEGDADQAVSVERIGEEPAVARFVWAAAQVPPPNGLPPNLEFFWPL